MSAPIHISNVKKIEEKASASKAKKEAKKEE